MAPPNFAQCQSGPSLLGTWRLVSYEARDSEGRVQYPLGENVSGLLVYDGGGNMSAHVMRNDLPPVCCKRSRSRHRCGTPCGHLEGLRKEKGKEKPPP